MPRIVLITGCSSGIGAALAREFHRRDHIVYASARRVGTLEPLAREGMRTLTLDVNDDVSVASALQFINAAEGRLDMLINNAGYSQVGATIDLSRDDLRAQFETNVIAPVAVARAALPLLRRAVEVGGRAVLVNVGSIVGLFTTPFAGAYCSSKAALHSLSDALRMELAPFGIRVVMLQPGGVRSAFGDHAEAAIRLPEDSMFKRFEAGIRARARAGQQGAMPASDFVGPVVNALLLPQPPAIIRGGKNSFRLPMLKRWLPRSVFDAKLARAFGLEESK